VNRLAVTPLGGLVVTIAFMVPLIGSHDVIYPHVVPKAVAFRIVLSVVLAYFVARLILQRYEIGGRDPVLVAWCGFLLIVLLSGLAGVAPQRSLFGTMERMWGAVTWFYLLVWYAVLRILMRGRRWDLALGAAAAVSVAVAFVALLQGYAHVLNLDVRGASRGTVAATLGNSSYLGIYLVLSVAVVLLLWPRTVSARGRALCAGSIAVLLWALTLSGARTAAVGLVIGAAAGGAVLLTTARDPGSANPRRRGRHRAAAVLLVAVAAGFGISRLADRFAGIGLSSTTFTARFAAWQAGWEQFREAPLLGIGPENFYIAVTRFFPARLHHIGQTTWDRAHNGYLEILVGSGIPGLLAYLAIWLAFFWSVRRAWKIGRASRVEAAILTGAGVAYLVYLLTWFDDLSSSVVLVLLFAYAGSLRTGEPLVVEGPPRERAPSRYALLALALLVIAVFTYQRSWQVWLAGSRATEGMRAGEVEERLDRFHSALDAAGAEALLVQGLYVDYVRLFGRPVVRGTGDPRQERILWAAIQRGLLELEAVSSIDPHNEVWWVDRSRLLLLAAELRSDRRFYRAAIEALERAIELGPRKIPTHHLLADLYLAGNLPNEALAALRAARRLDDTSGETYFRIARAHAAAGDLEGSRQALLRSLELGYADRPALLVWHLNRLHEQPDHAAELSLIAAFGRARDLAAVDASVLTREEFSILSRAPLVALRAGRPDAATAMAEELVDSYRPAARLLGRFVMDVRNGRGAEWIGHEDMISAARAFGGLAALDRRRR
jgi:O-antigen ligase/tetratricopeptide (TPR) repeat protein